ncbi:MAG TPA: DUF642 domain-containing protein, partial [Verrucomicrobiae bacterium]|nr:DUF642 domain-containing protein [Verrucomicrobiae bacterium]
NIESLADSQGTGPTSILYKNFQALKNAVPGIDAINDDDEQTYDLNSSTSFANMLGGLGYKFTMVPYENQSFWVNLKNGITNCDYIYLQCYEGGAGNDPGQWDAAFGNGVVVIPGQESNTANITNWYDWFLETGVKGGFYYPDVVFNNAYWSAAIIQGYGAVPPAPTGVIAIPGGQQVNLSWNTSPGATSYNVERSTISGGETMIANVSSANTWPTCNEYIDSGLAVGTTYYYEVSAVNANGESTNSVEVSAAPLSSMVLDYGFEAPVISDHQYNPSGASWTFSGASPDGSGLIANGSAFGNPNAPEGVQAAFVQEYGTITQTISGFIPGTNYTISFLAAERPGDSQSWNVTVDGSVVGSFNPGSSATSYEEYSTNFTATSATETLGFVGTDLAGGDNTIFIDDVQISLSVIPASPLVTMNTLPATAADVVDSQVTFTAAFTATNSMTYQWQKISGGTTNNIFGATNMMLTLTNLQLTNTASYQLRASNAYGVAVSAPGSLTVSSVPAPVNNVVTSLAAQTGNDVGVFTPTWIVATNGSLIADQSPSATSGNFSEEVSGRSVNSLTAGGSLGIYQIDGNYGTTTSANYVTCGNGDGAGSNIVYALTGSANGYNLTNITVYGGWKDNGRDQQAYTIYYSTVSNPTAFRLLGSVNYTPVNTAGVPCTTRATLTPANGVLATNVAAVEFDFASPASENGYCGYAQIAVFGAPSIAPAVPAALTVTLQMPNSFVMNIGSLVAGRNYMLQGTTNLASGVWITETNFVAAHADAFFTNSTANAVQEFYRVVGY